MAKSIMANLASVMRSTGIRLSRFGKRRRKPGDSLAAARRLVDLAERSLMLQGCSAARSLPIARRIRNLSEVEFRVFSQWGEDGIIEWLVANITVETDTFVEFGVESFREANCRFLLQHRNWKGLILDSDERNMATIRSDSLFWRHDLTARAAFITAENIDQVISNAGFRGPIGILSIDIDGNDYWVWEAVKSVQPAIVVCEYNPILGDTLPIAVPYDPTFRRFESHFSGLHFGASIAALKYLGDKKGFTFVGTNSSGINAFFVKDELAAPALELLDETRAFPSRHRDSRNAAGELDFVGGRARLDLIADMPVIDVSTGRTIALRDIEEPYSSDWLRGMA